MDFNQTFFASPAQVRPTAVRAADCLFIQFQGEALVTRLSAYQRR
jgi:hypothetical protein